MLEVRLLGKFEVRYENKLINIASRPAQSLFAYLILNAGIAHRREKLAGMLWPDSLEETARSNLRHALWKIRKSFPASQKRTIQYLLADDLAIMFDPTAETWLDVAEIEKLREDASTEELVAVLSHYQGDLLPGFYDEWVVLEREHLHSVYEQHMAQLMSLLENENRWLDILDWGERWIKFGQKPEPAYRALMSAHAAKGNMSKVVAAYERCAKSLKEFGIEPSEQTRALYDRLKAGKENLEIGSTIPATENSKISPKTNLPVPLTSFIGRGKAVEQIVQLVDKNRFVTLTGPGGVGKTRLAIQSSQKMKNKFKDGVWWVELAPLTDPVLVPPAVGQVLGVRQSSSQPLLESLKTFLREKQLLLILDNCEHIIRACAQFVEQLLTACDHLKILATSREALGLTSESPWPVPMLSLPNLKHGSLVDSLMGYEGIHLFVDRAGLANPDFMLTNQNAFSVMQVCERLDGMPLAIELAAARVKMMSVSEIAKRLDERFDFLTGGSRTALPRHQTLRATLDWSHDLLTGPERVLFRRLAAFAGGFTLRAVESVASGESISKSQIIDLLGQLINKSLVVVERPSEDSEAETRYGMLETIHEYAREKLREAEDESLVLTRHLEFFLGFAEEAQYELHAAGQRRWYRRLEHDHDNLRAALAWALQTHAIEEGMRIVGALHWFWWIRGYWSEGRQWAVKFISEPEGQAHTYARGMAVGAAGDFTYELGDLETGKTYLRDAVTIGRELGEMGKTLVGLWLIGISYTEWGGDLEEAHEALEEGLHAMEYTPPRVQWITAWLHHCLGVTLTMQEDYANSREHSEKSIEIALAMGDRYMSIYPLGQLGSVLARQGLLAEGKRHLQEALAVEREMGDRKDSAISLGMLGGIACLEGSYDEARATLEEALQISRELSWRSGVASLLSTLAFAEGLAGNYGRADELYRESLPLCVEYGEQGDVVNVLDGMAQLAALRGQYERAARLFGVSASASKSLSSALWYVFRPEHERLIQLARRSLGEETFTVLQQAGRTLAMEQVMEFVIREFSQ